MDFVEKPTYEPIDVNEMESACYDTYIRDEDGTGDAASEAFTANDAGSAIDASRKEDDLRNSGGNMEEAFHFMVDEDDNMLDEEMIYDDGTTIRSQVSLLLCS